MPTPFIVTPITLQGRHVRLEPLSEAHIPALAQAGRDPSIWKYMLYGDLTTGSAMAAWVKEILRRRDSGTDQPFVVIHLSTGEVVGSTRYMEIRPPHRSLEIGGTWYTPEVQRSAVNTESKFLLLEHAFEHLGCIRVQFKADRRNERSQRAIERLGAIKEGILRNHMILEDGSLRDSVFYSILPGEWPPIKDRLKNILGI